MGQDVKHDDARTLAFRVLVEVARPASAEKPGGARATEVLGVGLGQCGLDDRDRGLATELVYGVLRWQRSLDALLVPHLSRPLDGLELAARVWLRIGAYQITMLDRIPREIAVSATQDAARKTGHQRLTGLLNAVLRKVAARGPVPLSPIESLPVWVAGLLREAYPETCEREAAALRERPVTTVRPTLGKGGADAARASLEAAGLTVRDAPHGFLAVSGGDPFQTRAWQDGLFVAQDPAGAVVISGIGPGQRVLDVCAGRGIKATAMADRGALVTALDLSSEKLREASLLAERLGVSERLTIGGARDATRPLDDVGSFDEVVVDAPCSGLGTLRRHPEIVWRKRPEDISALADLQSRLLSSAALAVRPGGRLTYAVCSFVRVEGSPTLRCAGFELEERVDVAPSTGLDGFRVVRFRRSP